MNNQPASYSEVVTYWRGLIATLKQRGMLRQKRENRTAVIPSAEALVLPDRVIFLLDMNRLAGISREDWLDRDMWLQLRATLRGRRCFVADSAGLAVVVAREPGEPQRKRLPRRVVLEVDRVPGGRYTALLGVSRADDVVLDLARGERAMLIAGSSGRGKTTAILSILLQLIGKNGPDTLQLAIVDLKRLDFTPLGNLPHLVRPIATKAEDAAELVARVREEMERRFDVMSAAQVTSWDRMPPGEGFPLLLVVVDECADFAKSQVMDDLVELARKSRAAGISLILATQRPDKAVLSRQVKANLETRISFAVTDRYESQVILDRQGAEKLARVGQCLTNAGGGWRKAQAVYVPEDALGEWLDVADARPVLTEVEAALVRYAIKELDGAFVTDRLYEAQEDGDLGAEERLSKYAINKLAKAWERRGWLTLPGRNAQGHPVGRQVTQELERLANLTMTPTTTRTTTQRAVPRLTSPTTAPRSEWSQAGEGEVELPPFLEKRFSGGKL
jgi:hypothetical protein